MKLVVGLGNPGSKYEHTRHNVGFDVISKLQDKLGISNEREKFQGLISETTVDGEKVLVLKPQTFMNLSGNSIIEVINFYELDPKKDLIVIYDDMDLPVGKLRIKERGSSGGHNGIKSIISHIGDEFLRIKCGIGKSQSDKIDFVLGQFAKADQEEVDKMMESAANCAMDMIKDVKLQNIMQKYNNCLLYTSPSPRDA